jgi:outer membrane murein-binding lipoprotein Lpp
MTRQEIEQLAETQWEGCQGCDENDKMFWINGFVHGYLNARVDNLSDIMDNLNAKVDKLNNQIDSSHKKVADLLINGLDCHYSGLPSPKSYDI